jgi:predicted NAD/FAD-dependent oxidoreductase
MSKKKITSCLIIGAGITGLLAGHALKRRGVKVTVLDKGRGVGGRMATRRIENAVIDHGAQFFTVREERFEKWVQQWMDEGHVVEWSKGFQKLKAEMDSEDPALDDHPHYRGTKGMTAVPKELAKHLEVHLNCRVTKIIPLAKGWETHTEGGQNFRAQGIILTPPARQSLSILEESRIQLPSQIQSSIEAITYDPCIAFLALLDSASHVPYPGGLYLQGEPVTWIADNQRKGISPQHASITVHAGPKFSRENWETDDGTVSNALTEAASRWIGSKIGVSQIHRWRYSKPVKTHPERCLIVPGAWPLIFAGDAFGGPRIEGAALSGLAAAHNLLIQEKL